MKEYLLATQKKLKENAAFAVLDEPLFNTVMVFSNPLSVKSYVIPDVADIGFFFLFVQITERKPKLFLQFFFSLFPLEYVLFPAVTVMNLNGEDCRLGFSRY